jgi:hypothetical protein
VTYKYNGVEGISAAIIGELEIESKLSPTSLRADTLNL